jgi:hypothetical protein
MNVSEPGIAWGHACRSLQEVGQELHRQAQQPYAPQFAALQRVIEALNHGGAMRPRRCPAAYVVEWQRYVLDPTHRLPSRAIRYLCWEPSVALDAQFQSYLDVELGTLSTAMLHGLVWCCHACWSPAFAASAAVQWVQQQLLAYNGDNWLLQYWQQHPSGDRRHAWNARAGHETRACRCPPGRSPAAVTPILLG